MATAQRVFWETVAVLVFIALLVLAWFASGYRAGQRLQVAETDHQRALTEQAARHDEVVERVRFDQRREAEAQARAEAEAAFRGYASGIKPAVTARWRRYLNATRDELLEQPGFVFVHLMTPQGLILASTDEEFVNRGRVDERADWARGATELITRPGAEDGVLELAAPILEGDRAVAHLWIGYELGLSLETKPSGTLEPGAAAAGD